MEFDPDLCKSATGWSKSWIHLRICLWRSTDRDIPRWVHSWIQDFGGHWECPTLHLQSIPAIPRPQTCSQTTLDKAVTGLGAQTCIGTRIILFFCIATTAWGVQGGEGGQGRLAGLGRWVLCPGTGRGDNVLEGGTASHLSAGPQLGHHGDLHGSWPLPAGTSDILPHRHQPSSEGVKS